MSHSPETFISRKADQMVKIGLGVLATASLACTVENSALGFVQVEVNRSGAAVQIEDTHGNGNIYQISVGYSTFQTCVNAIAIIDRPGQIPIRSVQAIPRVCIPTGQTP